VRLETLKLRNIGAFREFAVDLTSMPGPLVAITGPNGAGKSTLLELGLPGAMYRETPTRGSLVDLATARDALVEARLVNGAPWTIRHLVDKVSGKSEAAVFDAAGAAVLPDTKVRSFDAWAAKHLPSPEVLYACMFAPQGADGFLGAKPGERKAVLLRLLGIEHYEALAKAAAELARTERSRLE
jgi:exonuclease SbcC